MYKDLTYCPQSQRAKLSSFYQSIQEKQGKINQSKTDDSKSVFKLAFDHHNQILGQIAQEMELPIEVHGRLLKQMGDIHKDVQDNVKQQTKYNEQMFMRRISKRVNNAGKISLINSNKQPNINTVSDAQKISGVVKSFNEAVEEFENKRAYEHAKVMYQKHLDQKGMIRQVTDNQDMRIDINTVHKTQESMKEHQKQILKDPGSFTSQINTVEIAKMELDKIKNEHDSLIAHAKKQFSKHINSTTQKNVKEMQQNLIKLIAFTSIAMASSTMISTGGVLAQVATRALGSIFSAISSTMGWMMAGAGRLIGGEAGEAAAAEQFEALEAPDIERPAEQNNEELEEIKEEIKDVIEQPDLVDKTKKQWQQSLDLIDQLRQSPTAATSAIVLEQSNELMRNVDADDHSITQTRLVLHDAMSNSGMNEDEINSFTNLLMHGQQADSLEYNQNFQDHALETVTEGLDENVNHSEAYRNMMIGTLLSIEQDSEGMEEHFQAMDNAYNEIHGVLANSTTYEDAMDEMERRINDHQVMSQIQNSSEQMRQQGLPLYNQQNGMTSLPGQYIPYMTPQMNLERNASFAGSVNNVIGLFR